MYFGYSIEPIILLKDVFVLLVIDAIAELSVAVELLLLYPGSKRERRAWYQFFMHVLS